MSSKTPQSKSGLAIAVIAGAQLMIVLDLTIVNVALPSIQPALHFSTTSLSWIINAYALVFGGLLLLGGRSGDIFGRRKMFLFGILLFAAASAFGGLAVNSTWLIAGRALQGVGAAIASPTALSLISTNFTEARERGRAFAIYSAVSAGGSAVGLIAGGLLTQYLSWRWVFYVNVPIALMLLILAPRVLQESTRLRGKLDVLGAAIGTLGLGSLVYGLIHAASSSWTDTTTLGFLFVGVIMLVMFVLFELRTPEPVIDFLILRNRNRAGAVSIILFVAAGMFGVFFFLTQYLQDVLHYSPTMTGVAFLPMTLTIMVFAQIASRLMHRFGPKPFMMFGGASIAIAMFWLSFLTPTSTYWPGVLPPLLILAAGSGASFVSIFPTATVGVPNSQAGMASALVTVGQQVGGTLGLSALVSLAASSSARFIQGVSTASTANRPTHAQTLMAATVHGWAMGFRLASVFGLVAFLIATMVVHSINASQLPATEGSEIAF
ncbi:MAG: MFS transporter [Ferrimicrobium sp.]